ncbi:hypothetical protein F2Q70_00037256 [Brassica cretica]|uniref:Uncharacterized protein n=1 Tax=Brassica cretica TaxID=69181 RepID=A0A8S9L2L5_BRACR|nr:hypothetical protein F2Q70_00037256 [Brassica cretica]KAF2600321.1 hypothetical protein F2Q68_00009466 [Brassica cretica]
MDGRYVAIGPRTSKSLRSNRPGHMDGRYVATVQATWTVSTYRPARERAGRYVTTGPRMNWSLCSDQPSHMDDIRDLWEIKVFLPFVL